VIDIPKAVIQVQIEQITSEETKISIMAMAQAILKIKNEKPANTSGTSVS